MGMLDQVLGNLLGSQQSGTPGASNSMSPAVKGILLLLATKAIQSYTASNRPGTQVPLPGRRPTTLPAALRVGSAAPSVGVEVLAVCSLAWVVLGRSAVLSINSSRRDLANR